MEVWMTYTKQTTATTITTTITASTTTATNTSSSSSVFNKINEFLARLCLRFLYTALKVSSLNV